ncbi:MAG: HlyD family efflux transporter periplasmic adaptor subunit [Sedimentisphaerales bacterium]
MKRIKTYRSGSLRPHILPILIWLVTAAVVSMLFYHRSQRFEVVGMAQGQVRQIATTCTGRLKDVPLELFQEVRKGDVVAIIDTLPDNEHLEAELAVANAEVQRLTAELAHTQQTLLAEAANLETDRTATQRRFYVDVENARLRVLDLKTQLETDRISLEGLELSIKAYFTQNSSDQNDVIYYKLQKMRADRDAMAKKIEDNQNLLAQAGSNLKQTEQRRDEFDQRQLQHPPVDSALEVVRGAIKVQEQRIDGLLAKREPLVLKSPIDGVVIQVIGRPRDVALRRPGEFVVLKAGEVVLAGETVVTIAETTPHEIIAYAGLQQFGRIREGMTVQLVKNTEPAQIANSKVASVGATLERMPEYLWEVPNIPQWGRPVLIPIPPGFKLIPGEMVGIKGL